MLKQGLFLLTIAIALMIAACIPIEGWGGLPLFLCQSPILMVVSAGIVCTIIYTFLFQKAYRKCSWAMLLHVALVVIAVGAVMRVMYREEGIPFKLYYNMEGYRVASLRMDTHVQEKSLKQLGFDIGCDSFAITYYNDTQMQVQSYQAQIFVLDSEVLTHYPLAPNAPAVYKDWRFYLMGYDEQAKFVALLPVRDPARPWVLGGCYLLIIATAFACFVQVHKLCRKEMEVKG